MTVSLFRQVSAILALVAAVAWSPPVAAQCPKVVINVDNDIAGSGYSETSKNWKSYTPFACHKTYRYLSKLVGDASLKGKAIWKPKIKVTGWYEVKISYRASTNRSTDADYNVYDDAGGKKHFSINQNKGSTCTYKVLGTYYCKAGGSCRVVLDGTDDSQSDCADMTTFTLKKCTGTPPANPCSGISAVKSYELCSWTANTCSGVYTKGQGCINFCAAAKMVCVKRYGGEPSCIKEANFPIPCKQSNTHLSDWCECAYPPGLDSGPPPKKDTGTPPPKKDTGTPPPKKDTGTPPPKKDTGSPPPKKDTGTPSPKKDTGKPSPRDHGGSSPSWESLTMYDGQGSPGASDGEPGGGERVSGGCECRHASGNWPTGMLLLVLLLPGLRRRRS